VLRNGLYSIALIASLCTAANASDIHRVVTSLDAANRSTTLLDSNVPLHGPGYPGAILWITDSSPPDFLRKISANGSSAFRRRTTVPCCAFLNFLRSMTPRSRAWTPIS
jgi:hypothetical protein